MVDVERIHAFTDDALGTDDAVGVARRIKTGEISAHEVLDAAIARLDQVGKQLNAVQVDCRERVRRQPAVDGPFAGVPSFIKDNTDVAGLPTCHGSRAVTPRPARRDAPPAKQFLAQGFTLLGKSTLPEFGLTPSTEYVDRPPTRNPWQTEVSAGGSSGGAAALVASGVVPLAHANDGGGSIRIPAALNGLVGLKPTRRRLLDRPGVRQLPVNLVSEGVVSRTVRDTAHYLAAAEAYHADPGLAPVGLVEGPGHRRLRIGLALRDLQGRPVHPATEAVVRSVAGVLEEHGHRIVETDLAGESRFVDEFTSYWALLAVLMAVSSTIQYGRRFDPRRLDPFTEGLVRRALRRPARTIAAAKRLRAATQLYDARFRDLDVVLMPVLAYPGPRIGELSPEQPVEDLLGRLVDYVAFAPIANAGGGPAIAVPHGLGEDGLPGSVQLCAPRGGERTLLELAYELEETSPFPRIEQPPDQ